MDDEPNASKEGVDNSYWKCRWVTRNPGAYDLALLCIQQIFERLAFLYNSGKITLQHHINWILSHALNPQTHTGINALGKNLWKQSTQILVVMICLCTLRNQLLPDDLKYS